MLLSRPTRIITERGLADQRWNPLLRNAKLLWAFDGQQPTRQFNIAGRRGQSSSHGAPVKAFTTLGPAIYCDGTDDAITFPYFPPASQKVTMALLGVFSNPGGSRDYLDTSDAVNAGFRLAYDGNTSQLALVLGGVGYIYTNPSVAIWGLPVFWSASFDANADRAAAVIRRLDTGAIIHSAASTSALSPLGTGDGVMAIGGANVFPSNAAIGYIAAAFISDDFTPLEMLRAWAGDPWGPFRYSDALDAGAVYAKAAGGGATTYTLSASMDAAIQRALSGTASMDAAIQVPRTATAALDAAVQAPRSAAAGLDAAVQVGRSAAAGLDAAIRRALTTTAGLDAVLVNRITAQADLDAAIRYPRSVAAAMDAFIDDGSGLPAQAAYAGFLANVGKLMRRG